MNPKPPFAGGRNIALKVPPHQYETTIQFYRDVIGLTQLATEGSDVIFEFGSNLLWIDRVETLSQSEIWLEFVSPDIPTAAQYLKAAGVVRRDEIESLPEGFDGFWISSPASTIHLVVNPNQA